jgi:hypothetical protein
MSSDQPFPGGLPLHLVAQLLNLTPRRVRRLASDRHRCREIRGALDGFGSCECFLGADGDTFTMSWTERDGPPVAAPTRRGFGTIVIEKMAERNVGAAVDLDYAPSGVTWRLTCPAANALELGNGTQISREGKIELTERLA